MTFSNSARYTSVAVALHWAIAVLILGQIAGGLYMHDLPNTAPWKFHLYQIHKSVGLSILALTFLRLGWRLTHKVPALPDAMPGWQKLAARATHWGFYALLILTPLAGWAMVSVSPKEIPTIWFGLVDIPHLPFFEGVQDRGAVEDVFKERHMFLAFTALFLLALHAGAALKHGFIDRDGVLRSMAPAAGAWVGIVALLAALGAGAVYSLNTNIFAAPARASAPVATDASGDVAPPAEMSAAASDASPTGNAVGEPESEPAERGTEPQPEAAEPATKQTVKTKPAPAAAPAARSDQPNWTVDADASRLRFIGEEDGARFEGEFADFTALIRFDENALDQSWVRVEVRTASGATGSELRDSSLPGGEWFDVKNHPTAQFVSNDFRHIGGDAYEAAGELTIKDVARPVTLAFTLAIDGDRAHAQGSADLVRTDFGLGADSYWLDEEKVALDVRVEFEIFATRSD